MIEEIRKRLAMYAPRELPQDGRPRAAVLLPLYTWDDSLHVIFTKRSELVMHHKGEIAFPGGAYEASDGDLVATALRESWEEIGLRGEDVRVIGRLDDVVTVSNFHVTVYVGEVVGSPYVWCLQEAEVDCVLEVPLSHLLTPSTLIEFPRERDGEVAFRPGYAFGEHIIWGATGGMLRNFLEIVAAAAPETTVVADVVDERIAG